MEISFDADFLEAAVSFCVSGRRPGISSLQLKRFHASRDQCYSSADSDERNAAFGRLYQSWFKELGLHQLLVRVLDEFPVLAAALDVIAFREAHRKGEENADLYVNQSKVRNAMVCLCVDRFAQDESLNAFLRHELMHLEDMVEPAFGYVPRLGLDAQNRTQLAIARERYRLLWDITIDGRLTGRGRVTISTCRQHEQLFERAFHFWPEEKRRAVFEKLWSGPNPSHSELASLVVDPRDAHRSCIPLPGGLCPLCQFPTFEWLMASEINPELQTVLQAKYPEWTPDQGVCKRCVEIYELAGKFAHPTTIDH